MCNLPDPSRWPARVSPRHGPARLLALLTLYLPLSLPLYLPITAWAQIPVVGDPNAAAHAARQTQAIQAAINNIAPTPPAAPPSHLVRELLEQDARRALLLEQRGEQGGGGLPGLPGLPLPASSGMGNTNDGAAPASAETLPVQITAIAGIGRDLSVVLIRAGVRTIYRAGQPVPITGPDPGLRLVRVDAPCAVFQDISGTDTALDKETDANTLTLCLYGNSP